MGGRMVLADRGPARMIDFERKRSAYFDRPLLDRAGVHEHVAGLLLGIGDLEAKPVAEHDTGIADLAAGLRVERSLVENDRTAFSGLEGLHVLAVLHQRGDHSFGALGLIAQKFGGTGGLAQAEP